MLDQKDNIMKVRSYLAVFVTFLAISFFASSNPAFSQDKSITKNNLDSNSFLKTIQLKDKKVQDKKISLDDFVRNYDRDYSKVFISTLSAVSRMKLGISSFNSSKGEIMAKLLNNKELFIVVYSSDEKNTLVRITPANGIYDFDEDIAAEIFKNIKIEITRK